MSRMKIHAGMRKPAAGFVLISMSWCAFCLHAQDSPTNKAIAKRPGAPAITRSAKGINVPRVSRPPTLADFEGMQPHAIAAEMARLSDFIQSEPSDGSPATQRTEVYLGYDALNLYAIWLCFDSEPKRLRAHLSRREQIYSDDIVELMLDTFHDQRHALMFDTNQLGIQRDALWTEGSNSDNSWDTVWYTRGELTASGYMVEQTIPFRSLRFHPSPEQQWGVVLIRY